MMPLVEKFVTGDNFLTARLLAGAQLLGLMLSYVYDHSLHYINNIYVILQNLLH